LGFVNIFAKSWQQYWRLWLKHIITLLVVNLSTILAEKWSILSKLWLLTPGANLTTFEFTAMYNASVVSRLKRFYIGEKIFLF
jgi:hypothetical protein